MQIASKLGVTPPAELEGKHKRTETKLSKLQGDKFDREYMEDMVDDHKDDIKLFEKQAKNGKNEEVKQFAASALPTLQEHLKKAQQIEAALKKGGKGG